MSEQNDTIYRQAAIEYFVTNCGWCDEDGHNIEDTDELRKIWTDLFNGVPPTEQNKVILDKETILQAGYQGKEIEFHIGGRLFAIREKAQ